jgi:hypothetical protein
MVKLEVKKWARTIFEILMATSFPILIVLFLYNLYYNQASDLAPYGHVAILGFYLIVFFLLFQYSVIVGKRHITTMINYRIVAILTCIACYTAVSVAWRENEREFDYKVFDVFKTHEPGIHNELEKLRNPNDGSEWHDESPSKDVVIKNDLVKIKKG